MFKEFKAPAAYNPLQRVSWYMGLVITFVICVTVTGLMIRGMIFLWSWILGA